MTRLLRRQIKYLQSIIIICKTADHTRTTKCKTTRPQCPSTTTVSPNTQNNNQTTAPSYSIPPSSLSSSLDTCAPNFQPNTHNRNTILCQHGKTQNYKTNNNPNKSTSQKPRNNNTYIRNRGVYCYNNIHS